MLILYPCDVLLIIICYIILLYCILLYLLYIYDDDELAQTQCCQMNISLV